MRILGRQFVLGRTIEEALKRAREYADNGYRFSFDMLGEAALMSVDQPYAFQVLVRKVNGSWLVAGL